MVKPLTLFLSVLLCSLTISAQTEVELVGKAAVHMPFFRWVQNVNMDQALTIALDGKQYPAIANVTADVYVVTDRSASEWLLNQTLMDVTTGGARSCHFLSDSIQQNVFQLAGPHELVAYNAVAIGVGYDIVIDMDGDGLLSAADFIDGGDGPGFYALHDIRQPGLLAVTTQDWIDTATTSVPLTKRVWYPTNIGSMDSLPLIMISHGWTYNYTHYNYIAEHLASYGYIVVSHWNDVRDGDPDGTNTASLSLIASIDHLLAHQDTLWGGVLDGKIDHRRMGWMGHSTGGESIVRAYTRLHDGTNSATHFTWQDVQYISSFCPVSWFPDTIVNPYAVNYHQFLGGADNDVSGLSLNTYTQPMTIYERGIGNKHIIYVHGAGHGVFNDDSTAAQQWVSGPDLINRAQLHPLVQAYTVAMSEWHCKQNLAGKEFFTRSYPDYHPMNADPAVVISNEYRDAQTAFKKVIDNFETNSALQLASSGATVASNLLSSAEVLMRDIDGSFSYGAAQPSNGMTRARFTDAPHCLTLKWDSIGFVQYTIPDSLNDFSAYEFLSFRACQRTRHPFNVALDSSINFYVTLVDENANTATVEIAAYGPIIQTYQRLGGWQNEFCTVRIRLGEFLVNGTQLNLSAIENLSFSFGSLGTSAKGALGIDDIELVNQGRVLPTQVADIQVDVADISIYPNPSSGLFVTVFPHWIAQGNLEVFSVLGERVFAEIVVDASHKEINFSNMAQGIYFVKVWDGAKSYCKKIVVE